MARRKVGTATQSGGSSATQWLPQDALARGARERPNLSAYNKSLDAYRDNHARAVAQGDFPGRVEACWGLVAHGADAIPWAIEGLEGDFPDRASDAAGVLAWIDRSPAVLRRIEKIVEKLDDGEARDTLFELIGHKDTSPQEEVLGLTGGLLFDGRLEAFTESIWFVEGSFDAVKQELIDWNRELKLGRSFKEFHKPLERALDRLEPWAIPSWKFLLFETSGPWCAVFSQGSDIYPTNVVGKRLGSRSLYTSHSPHIVREGMPVSYGNTAFWYESYGDQSSHRSVQATYQSRWEWHEYGDALAFEQHARYGSRLVRERFDLPLLNQYCAALGIDRANPSFYGPRVILEEDDLSRWERQPTNTMSAAEWLARNR